MKTFKVTKEQLQEAHKAACIEWKTKLEGWFPEAFRAEFKSGDWIADDYGNIICITSKPQNVNKPSLNFEGYGFSFDCFWEDKAALTSSTPLSWRKATRKEVTDVLTKEAKIRFGDDWQNAKIKFAIDGYDTCFNEGLFAARLSLRNQLWNKNGVLFSDGKWAEPLKYEEFETIRMFGSDLEFKKTRPKQNKTLEQRVESIEKTLKRIEDKL